MSATDTYVLPVVFALLLHSSGGWAQNHRGIWVDGDGRAKDVAIKASTYATLAEKISPAVLNIAVTLKTPEDALTGGESAGLGTGFIIHPTGLFLTNYHVVQGADTVKVRLFDNREMDAEFVGIDPETDIALMRIIKASNLPTVALGNSEAIEVGERVLAIGNPMGLGHTVTAGIVSAVGRRNLNPGGKDNRSDFIQTDASINPGNSGGPLVSLSGEVIGINTAVNRSAQGIGFALPINVVKAMLPQLHADGVVRRAWLGVRAQDLNTQLASSFGRNNVSGALVTEVVDKSPGQRAGFRPGDIVLRFAGVAIRSSDQLSWLISTHPVAPNVPAIVWRERSETTLQIDLEELPNQKVPAVPTLTANTRKSGQIGIDVKPLTDTLARQLGAPDEGVVVAEIASDSPARSSGLRRRDVVVEVGSLPVKSVDDWLGIVNQLASDQVVRLKVVRGGRVVYVAFER